MLREPVRWQTPLGEWTQGVSARALAELVGVTPDAVYKWISGTTVPRVEVALRLVEFSGGKVSLVDVFTQRVHLELLRGDPCNQPPHPTHWCP